ncbi:MAG TPA: class I SAM-dependent methyltransferase, partial [Thermomicrobiales bacterium]|nr:class I SAM-dependent methyltransferase [Thermomicrobiales bacterium]
MAGHMKSQPRWQQVGSNAAEIYDTMLVPAMFAPWAPVLIDTAAVRPGERVIDIACGTGVVTRLAAMRVGGTGRVVGLDINAAMLAVARSQPTTDGVQIEWLEANALAVPLPDASFDVVLCQHGLQQFPDPLAALCEMHRLLVDGGRLALCVWSQIEGSPGMAALVAALERHVSVEAANNRRAPFALSDAGEVRDLIEKAGFSDVDIRTLAEPTRFASPKALVEAQLAATPLSTLGAISDDTRQAIAQDVRAALEPYQRDDRFAIPMEAHVASAKA